MNHPQQAPNGTYRVLRELGVRAQNTFAALRGGKQDLVVVQRFPRSLASFDTILREANCLAKNWHPNVNRVRHVDIVGDELFVATELIDGMTLSDLFAAASAKRANDKDPILPPPVLTRIVLDVLAGLHGLHTMRDEAQTPLKTIHGAVCARNIVIGKDGVARLIAVFRPKPLKMTEKSEALRYAAPEVLEEGAVDHRSDVYACGVILWEGLQGKRLFTQKLPSEILHRQREGEIAWNADTDSAVKRLKPIVLKALEFDPSLRFSSGAELVAALRRIAGPEIATGSAVAHKVMELAGERIKTRRAELEQRPQSREMLAQSAAQQDLSHAAEVPPVTLKKPPTPDSPLAHAQGVLNTGGPLPQRPLVPTSERKLVVGPALSPIPTPNAPMAVVALPERELDPTMRASPTSDPILMKAALPSEPRLPPSAPKSDPMMKAAVPTAPKSDPIAKAPPPVPSSQRAMKAAAPAVVPPAPKSDPIAKTDPMPKGPAIRRTTLRGSEPLLVTSPQVTQKPTGDQPLLVRLPPKEEKRSLATTTTKASPAPPPAVVAVPSPPPPIVVPGPSPSPPVVAAAAPTPTVAAPTTTSPSVPGRPPPKPTLIGVAPPAHEIDVDADDEPVPESLDGSFLQSEPNVPVPDAPAATVQSPVVAAPPPTPTPKPNETAASPTDVESEPLLLVSRAPQPTAATLVAPPPAPVRKAAPQPVTIAPMPKPLGAATRPIPATDVPNQRPAPTPAPAPARATPQATAQSPMQAPMQSPSNRGATTPMPAAAARGASPIGTPAPMSIQSSFAPATATLQKRVPLRRAMAIIAAAIMLTLLVIVIVARRRPTEHVPEPIAVKTNGPRPVDPPPTPATTGDPIALPSVEEDAATPMLYPWAATALDAGALENDPKFAVPEPTTSAPPARKTPYEPLGI